LNFLPKKIAKKFFLISSFSSLVVFNIYNFSESNPDTALLNKGTTALFQNDKDGKYIHCNSSENYTFCVNDHLERGGELAAWFGNSQLHAINQYIEGQDTAPLILHNMLLKNNKDLITFSYGNANLQEHLIQYNWLRKKKKPKVIILSLVFDDTREGGLRDDLKKILSKEINNTIINYSKLNYSEFIKNNYSENIEIKKNLIPQERLETYLSRRVGNFSNLWKSRSEIAYRYFVFLNRLKNTVFNIKPETKRSIIKPIFEQNLEALKTIIKIAYKDETKVYLYIAPINYGHELPYFEYQYEDFKSRIRKISDENKNVYFDNFDRIIPNNLWGLKDSTSNSQSLEIDFMHFTATAHELLSKYIYQRLQEID